MKLIIEIEKLEKKGKFNISGNVQFKTYSEYEKYQDKLPFALCPCEDEQGVYDSFYYKEEITEVEIKEEKNKIKNIYKLSKGSN